MARPPRERRGRRELERALRKNVRRVQRLAEDLPGGAPERPIDVPSAAVVATKALATLCLQCGGDLELRRDGATSTPRGVLRELELACRRCHAPRRLWFRVAVAGAN
jgi:hypothetical protein